MIDTQQPNKDDQLIPASVGAIVAVDIGSLHTRAAMFDVVGDEYRFMARAAANTTSEPPHSDVTVGVFNALRELEQITGRRLIDDTRLLVPQRRDGSGIDLFIATSSAAPALRLVVAAVSNDVSEKSAAQAAQSTYTQIVSHITLDEGIEEVPTEENILHSTAATAWFERQRDKLLGLPPDVVLLAGGIDKGPVAPLVRLAQVVSGAAREQGRRAENAAKAGKSAPGMPSVIYAGNPAAFDNVRDTLAPIRDVRAVPNVRPTMSTEHTAPTEAALATLYRDQRVPQLPGYSLLARWVEGHILPTAECERLIARYLHSYYGRETLIVDVGATSTMFFLANAQQDKVVVLGDIGMAYGLGNLLSKCSSESVLRWLPFRMSAEELADWVLNKVVRPLSLPQTTRDLAIEHALAREALSLGASALQSYSAGEMPSYDLLIGTGGLLAHTPRPGQAALILLDSLQPTAEGLGSVELAIDSTILIPAIGNLARHQTAPAAYIFDRDCLQWLGTAIVIQGQPNMIPGGEPPTAVTVTVERQQGGEQTVTVPYGSIQVIPLRPDQRASLTVKPAPGFRVGGGEPGKTLKTQPGQEVKGGLVGLIIDARGRPFLMPTDHDARAATLRQWWTALDAMS